MNENDETDKKLFLKVLSDEPDQDNLERILNVINILFRKSSENKEN